MNEVEEVRQRLDVVDLISQYVTLKKAGANYKGVCPFHQEKTPSMMVSPQKQIWKCFGCGKGGDIFSFIMEAEHLEFGDALRLLAQKAGVQLKPRTQAEHQSQTRKDSLYRINELASRIFEKILWETADGKIGLAYLKKRGLDDKTIEQFRLGFASRRISVKDLMLKKGVSAAEIEKAGSPDKFFDRIIFPIFDVMGHIIGFTGRTLGDAQPKYLNSPETPLFNKSRVLYGLNFAKAGIKEKDAVVLVEGQFDVISLHHHGIAAAVASSGTAITESQIQILSKYTANFFLAFDSDTAGINTTKKVIEILLRADLNGRVISFGNHKDADELLVNDPAGWGVALEQAEEAVDWLIGQAIREVKDIKQIEDKKAVLKQVLPTVKLIDDPARLDHAAQRLATKLGLSVDSIYASIAKAKSSGSVSSSSSPSVSSGLTSEEQLLAILLGRPAIIAEVAGRLKEVSWRSNDAQSIAAQLLKWYTDKALVTNQNQFLSQVKNQLDSQLAQKMDSWMFWLSSQWEALTDPIAAELAQEKLQMLSTKKRDTQREQLAVAIGQAQEKGDINEVKKLMEQLNELTKEGK